MKRSAIRLRWAPFRHRVILALLWIFYRILERVALRTVTSVADDIGACLGEAVRLFADDGLALTVYNFKHVDGRVFTVMIAQVCGEGPPTRELPHV